MCKSTIWALALHIYKYVTVQPTPFAFHCFAVSFAHKMALTSSRILRAHSCEHDLPVIYAMAELLQIIKKHLHK